jgi:hypothetical protein
MDFKGSAFDGVEGQSPSPCFLPSIALASGLTRRPS